MSGGCSSAAPLPPSARAGQPTMCARGVVVAAAAACPPAGLTLTLIRAPPSPSPSSPPPPAGPGRVCEEHLQHQRGLLGRPPLVSVRGWAATSPGPPHPGDAGEGQAAVAAWLLAGGGMRGVGAWAGAAGGCGSSSVVCRGWASRAAASARLPSHACRCPRTPRRGWRRLGGASTPGFPLTWARAPATKPSLPLRVPLTSGRGSDSTSPPSSHQQASARRVATPGPLFHPPSPPPPLPPPAPPPTPTHPLARPPLAPRRRRGDRAPALRLYHRPPLLLLLSSVAARGRPGAAALHLHHAQVLGV